MNRANMSRSRTNYWVVIMIMFAIIIVYPVARGEDKKESSQTLTQVDASGRVVTLKDQRTGEELIAGKNVDLNAVVSDKTGAEKSVQLNTVNWNGNILTTSSGDLKIQIMVKEEARYFVFRILSVQELGDQRLLRFSVKISTKNPSEVVPLDYVTTCATARMNAQQVELPWIWGRNDKDPLGSFALFFPIDDMDYDEILLHLWANEGLPHPKVEGEWTADRARAWLKDWQARFVDQSTMIVNSSSPEELY